jgi:hypothetical protein
LEGAVLIIVELDSERGCAIKDYRRSIGIFGSAFYRVEPGPLEIDLKLPHNCLPVQIYLG